MTLRLVITDPEHPDPEVLRIAAALLQRGEVVAFATETVYGLGADATSDRGVARIFAAKGRPPDNPLIVHAADVTMARAYASVWPVSAERLAQAFWPGPLTIVVPKRDVIVPGVSAGLGTVALRVPQGTVARALIVATGRPLAAPSANRSEHVSPTSAAHVLADLDGRIAAVIDSGPCSLGIESTVVDVSGDPPRLLRPGPIGAATIESILGGPIARRPPKGPARSPGQRQRHYAPNAITLRFRDEGSMRSAGPGPRDVVLVLGHKPELQFPLLWSYGWTTPELAARELYAVLRHADHQGAARILIVMPPLPEPHREDPWEAVRDRITRASR